MIQSKISAFLTEHNQTNLKKILQGSNAKAKLKLLIEIEKYLQIVKKVEKQKKLENIYSLKSCQNVNEKNYKSKGFQAIQKQNVACLVFAAGDGSRFKLNKPKGLFCIEENISLFANLCKWILAYQIEFKIKIPLLILVSTRNNLAIQKHFKEHQFFKLDPSCVVFLEQENYPFLDKNMQWIIDSNYNVLSGPNGNGGFLNAFSHNNTIEFLQKRKIKYLQFFSIDNPLIDPLDPNLLGFLIDENIDATIHAFKRDDLFEKVGVICEKNNNHYVLDYMQINESSFSKLQGNNLDFLFANSNHFCITLDAIAKLLRNKIKLPYHLVWKKINSMIYGYKVEKFAFDIFPYLKTKALCYEKELTFAPLKSFNDVKKVKQLLKMKNQIIYQKVYKKKPSLDVTLSLKDIVNYLKSFF